MAKIRNPYNGDLIDITLPVNHEDHCTFTMADGDTEPSVFDERYKNTVGDIDYELFYMKNQFLGYATITNSGGLEKHREFTCLYDPEIIQIIKGVTPAERTRQLNGNTINSQTLG